MFNPAMFEQARRNMANMDPEQMKQMSGMFANMSDEQIKSYASMAGMGNIDPSLLRNSAQFMKNMRGDDIKNMANMAPPPNGSSPSPPSQSASQVSAGPTDSFPKITVLKGQGNDAFKRQDYDEASSKYLEAIMEIEELHTTNKSVKTDPALRKEFQALETSCRLNYCNVKAKQEYKQRVVFISKALQVLQKEENGKAYFRLGQAQRHQGDLDLAIESLDKAIELLPNDATVKQFFDETKHEIREKSKKRPARQTEEKVSKPSQPIVVPEEQKQEPKVDTQPQTKPIPLDVAPEKFPKVEESPKEPKVQQPTQSKPASEEPRIKKPVIQEWKPKAEPEPQKQEPIPQPKPQEPEEVKINTEADQPKPQPSFKKAQSTPAPVGPAATPSQAQLDQLKNMSPEQMTQMTSMLKGMDKGFLKQMLKQQTGTEMSDAQIEMMQNMMTPEMLRSMQNIDPAMIQQSQAMRPQFQAQSTTTTTSAQPASQIDQQEQPTRPQQPTSPAMPTMSGFIEDPSMIYMLLQQLKSNPEMLKTMCQMAGPNPVSNYIEHASPQQISRLVGSLIILLNVVLFAVRMYKTMQRYWLLIVGVLIAYIIFR